MTSDKETPDNRTKYNMLIILVMGLFIVCLILSAVVLFQGAKIESLEYTVSVYGAQNKEFSQDIRGLETRLTVACGFRSPNNNTETNINWDNVCDTRWWNESMWEYTRGLSEYI
jgi:hypothetical protein